METRDLYGNVWISMILYGFVWMAMGYMDISWFQFIGFS